jgi:transglutaminase-like putative cysteine protease
MTADRAQAAGGIGAQIPRLSLALLMLAQAAVVLPHAAHLSLWVIAVSLVCAASRWMVFQGRWSFPARWVKVLIVVVAAVAVVVDGAGPFSLETATSLLVVAFALKLLEMRSRRDAYVVIFLCYFVIATEFLFDQSIAVTAYELVALVAATAAMVGLNQMHTRIRPLESLRTAGVLVLQALPLMLVLFLFFPRIAPLWSVPLPNGTRTGITDRVAPGDIAELTQSDEIVLRANFETAVPATHDLYWRGLVYSHYADGVWSSLPPPAQREPASLAQMSAAVPGSPTVRYEALQEPNQEVWLFALETPAPLSDSVLLTRDFRLVAREPIMGLFRFRAAAFPVLHADPELPDWLATRETALPDAENPRARAFARRLYEETGSPVRYLDALLRHIREEPFHYTLRPPLADGPDSIDTFWFETRAGFCSHFAGAFVFLARAAGIPARMVGGYQGGRVNPITGHLVVRQYDAHAWAEAWLPASGWVRYDPTGAVAPARIEQGLDAALSEPDRESIAAFSALRLAGVAGLADVLFWLESLEHRWNLWVVGYDTTLQRRYLEELLGDVSPARIGLVMLMGGAASLLLVAVTLFWRRRAPPGHPLERALHRFGTAMARIGLGRAPQETPRGFLLRVGSRLGRSPAQLMGLVESVDRLLYNPDAAPDAAEWKAVRRGLRRLRLDATLRARDS